MVTKGGRRRAALQDHRKRSNSRWAGAAGGRAGRLWADAPVRRALAAVVEAAEASLTAELKVLVETHNTLGLDRATEPSGERLIGAGRLVSVSAAGGHGFALATTGTQPHLAGLEVDTYFPHAIGTYTLMDNEMRVNGDEGWWKAGGSSGAAKDRSGVSGVRCGAVGRGTGWERGEGGRGTDGTFTCGTRV